MSVSLARRFIAPLVLFFVVFGTIAVAPHYAAAQGGPTTQQPAGAPAATPPAATAATPPDCTGWSMLTSLHCVARTFVWVIGTPLMILSGWMLGLAGTLFNFLIDFTIIKFGHYYVTHIKLGLEAAWVVLRDLANIAIIGAFVFVAISTILGNDSFGVRRFIARILIAAILINFSLFFAKFAIDVSHIVARAFEVGIAGSRPAQEISVSSINAPSGIAGAFLQQMKITSVWDSGSVIDRVGQNSQNAWVGLLYAVLMSVLFVAAAVILFYGSFLLLVRAVVLIMLLLASALAFAAIAIPGKEAEKWRGKWLDEFVKNVLFAPLLLMFLWATITITSKMGASTGSLADLATNPGSTLGLGALVNYAIVLGLLFLSIKMAKSLSTSGPLLNRSVAGVLGRFGSRVGNVGGSLVGASGVYTLGKLANKRLYERAELLKSQAARSGISGWMARREIDTLQAMRRGSFNPTLVKGAMVSYGKDFAKKYGFGEGGKGGYEASLKRTEERISARRQKYEEKVNEVVNLNKGPSQRTNTGLGKEALAESKPTAEEMRSIFEKNIVRAVGKDAVHAAPDEYQDLKRVTNALEKHTNALASGNGRKIQEAADALKLITSTQNIADARVKAAEMARTRESKLAKALEGTQVGMEAMDKALQATTSSVESLQKARATRVLAQNKRFITKGGFEPKEIISALVESKKKTMPKQIAEALKEQNKTP